jgi:hypothetical protein
VKSGRNIVGHGDVNIFLGVVPFDGEATMKFAFPVGGDGGKVLEGLDKVVILCLPTYLTPKSHTHMTRQNEML